VVGHESVDPKPQEKSAKECVTTHLPNELALKMDGAEANYPDSATTANARRS